MLATLRHRDFALLWTAGLVSVAGDFALLVALPLHVYTLTGSATATGGVFAASIIPRVLLGSIAGVFVDRWDRKRTMVAADLLRALFLLPLLLVVSSDLLWLLFLVRAAMGTVGLLFDPAENALLPRLVGEERLVAANALNALNNNLGRLVGPALGGLVYAAGGLTGVVLADAATFLVSAALVAAIRADGRPDRADTAAAAGSTALGRAVAEWRDGLRLVRRIGALRVIFAATVVGFVGEGTFEVGFTPLLVDVLGAGPRGIGLIVSAQAIGGIAAGIVIARGATIAAPRLLFGGGMVLLGLTDLGLANAANLVPRGTPAVTLACVIIALAGPPIVASSAAGTGLIQTLTADAFRGRVFGALGAVQGLAILVGIGLGGLAVDAFGIVPVVSVGAAMWIVGGLLALARLPRDAPAPAPTPVETTGRPPSRPTPSRKGNPQ